MSSPSFGPMQDFVDRAERLGHNIAHPLDALKSLMAPAIQSTPVPTHQQAIDEMNRQGNSHNNDAANESFRHGVLTQAAKKAKP